MYKSRSIVSSAAQSVCDLLESRTLLTATLWTVNGDVDGEATDDVIVIQVNPSNSKQLQALVNDDLVDSRLIKSVSGIQINGGGGDDDITLDLGPDLDNIDCTILGGQGDDSIEGGAGDDVLRGGGGDDELSGGLGDDNLWGGWGDDELLGDEGSDDIWGQGDKDTVIGGLGDDDLRGGDGSDQLSGGYDEDVMRGGDGKDTLRGGDGADSMNGGGGSDAIFRQEIDYWKYDRFDRTKWDIRVNDLQTVDDRDALKQKLIDLAMQRWQGSFDQPVWHWWYLREGGGGVYAYAAATDGAPPPGMEGAGGSVQTPTHSNTNTQEAGVDEADIVKTDGNYIYLVQNNELMILDAWPADETHIISRTPVVDNGWVEGIYLDGDKLTVISSSWTSGRYDVPVLGGGIATTKMIARPIWGGWWSKPQVVVTVLDVSDRANPKKLSGTTYDGSLTSSRKVDSRLYLVLNNSIDAPAPQIIEKDGNSYYESADSYKARLEAMDIMGFLPKYAQHPAEAIEGGYTTQGVQVGYLGEENLYVPDSIEDQQNMFSIVLIDITKSALPQSSTSVVGFSGDVYASTQNLYVTAQSWDAPLRGWDGETQTDIYKFALNADSVPLAGVGEVPGWVLNQFSMGENGDDFHIDTTTSASGVSNNVFTLQDKGEHLEITGGITGLAMTERIYSARFIGDRGYLVTFRQIDPLFTLDLSDPTKPDVAGILKIPGYSSYLHPVGENLVIGFGRDATPEGRIQGLQASLFDVSDIHNPKLIDTYKFPSDPTHPGWYWTSSGAEWDHHAFSYFDDEKVLAIPVLDWGWWNGQGKLSLLKLDETTGFTKLADIQHDGEVSRSLRIDHFIYSIGTDAVKVISLDDPDTVLTSVDLPNSPDPDPVPILLA